MLVCYVCGPYRDSRGEWYVRQNIEEAARIAVELWRMGFAVVCPHLNTAFFGGACPDETWLKGDLEILSRCDLMVVSPRWRESEGARGEVTWARDNEMLIISSLSIMSLSRIAEETRFEGLRGLLWEEYRDVGEDLGVEFDE